MPPKNKNRTRKNQKNVWANLGSRRRAAVARSTLRHNAPEWKPETTIWPAEPKNKPPTAENRVVKRMKPRFRKHYNLAQEDKKIDELFNSMMRNLHLERQNEKN